MSRGKPLSVHFQHPAFHESSPRCGLNDVPTVQITIDYDNVTCKLCINHVTGRRTKPGQRAV